MNFNTINNIIDDIMLEMRKNNITESENYNRKQIEMWIIQYRSAFINASIANGIKLSSNYYQEFDVEMESSPFVTLGSNMDVKVLKSTTRLPDAPLGISSFATVSIFDDFGNEIQVMSKKRSKINRKRRNFINDRVTAYIDGDNKICLDNNDFISNLHIRGIFLNPANVPGFNYNKDRYPIEPADLPEIKRHIFENEIKINVIPDTRNDGRETTMYANKR